MSALDQASLDSAFSRFTPKKEEPQPVTASDQKQKIKAKLDHTVPNICQYCGTPMVKTRACGTIVYLCSDDRHVSPMPDADVTAELTTSGGTAI